MTTNTQTIAPREKNGAPTPANGHENGVSKSPPPALPLDLAALPDDVLAALATEAQREVEQRHAKKKAEFLAYVAEQAAVLGVTPARLAAALSGKASAQPGANGGIDGRSVVRPKYRNPKDHAQTWAGRGGTPPHWYTAHLEGGGSEADMVIPEGAV